MTANPDLYLLLSTIFWIITLFGILLTGAMLRNDWRKKKYERHLMQQEAKRERDLVAARIQEQDDTLDRISHELHDNVCHGLQLLKMKLRLIAEEVPNAAPALQAALNYTSEIAAGVRELSHSLNSNFVKEAGLIDFLQQQVLSINLNSRLNGSLKVTGVPPQIPPEKELNIIRIAQELIHNAVRHSGASQLNIAVNCSPQRTTLQVSDNGNGFDEAGSSRSSGMGRALMYERARDAGATLQVDTAPGAGTSAKLHIHLNGTGDPDEVVAPPSGSTEAERK